MDCFLCCPFQRTGRCHRHLVQCLEWRVDWLAATGKVPQALGDTICDLAHGGNGRGNCVQHKKAHARPPWLKHAQLSVCGFILLLVRCMLLIWLVIWDFVQCTFWLPSIRPFGFLTVTPSPLGHWQVVFIGCISCCHWKLLFHESLLSQHMCPCEHDIS